MSKYFLALPSIILTYVSAKVLPIFQRPKPHTDCGLIPTDAAVDAPPERPAWRPTCLETPASATKCWEADHFQQGASRQLRTSPQGMQVRGRRLAGQGAGEGAQVRNELDQFALKDLVAGGAFERGGRVVPVSRHLSAHRSCCRPVAEYRETRRAPAR